MGQFNQDGGKRQPYDEDIRVPLIVRGPGVPANSITSALATNIDMVALFYCDVLYFIIEFQLSYIIQAPTLMELAGQTIPEDMDGVSLKQLLISNEEREKQVEYMQGCISRYYIVTRKIKHFNSC